MRALVAMLLLLPTTALAGRTYVLGSTYDTSCGQFIAATEGRKLGTSIQYESQGTKFISENGVMMEWVLGLLSGINLQRDAKHQIQNDPAAIELWLRNWCMKNPTSPLFFAVTAFAAATPGTPIK